MATNRTLILNAEDIKIKIKRIALQIIENSIHENEIVIAGIAKNGYILAKLIAENIKAISDLKIQICEVTIDKKNPLENIEASLSPEFYKDKTLILVDDVLNSGTTLIYACKYFLEVPLKQFKTAVLVDRNHKKFPIKADFKGISLSTSLNEMVEVSFENSPKAELY
ncbi:phosphoribosyltransferase family protein [Psychroflexus aestuariivivens]|uniref:phosphoribosyltransferase family protein n=1 Tax=Psychroflexus aestuariivivens TaxID=1795040 RepID=UPI000FD8A01A|nr:phosphoribosyltransferase family protein [Psychroflexus aestuariivivens]